MADAALPAIDDVRAVLTDAMTGTIGIKNPPSDVLDRAEEAARQSAAWLSAHSGTTEEALEALGGDLPGDLRAWLFELPSFLAKKQRRDRGLELCDLLAEPLGDAYLGIERAFVHLEAGEKDEAYTQLDTMRQRAPDHPWVLLRASDLEASRGKTVDAARDLERAFEAAKADGAARDDLRACYDAMIQHHQDGGDAQRAAELGGEMLEVFPEIRDEFRTEQIVHEGPKVGRNDPCPCGSGKKFKKCCGKPA